MANRPAKLVIIGNSFDSTWRSIPLSLLPNAGVSVPACCRLTNCLA
jgi:hypothetical protein